MKTPNGEDMVAIPYSINFTTWMSLSEAEKYMGRWQEVREVVASGTAEMIREKFLNPNNEGWQVLYLEMGSTNLLDAK